MKFRSTVQTAYVPNFTINFRQVKAAEVQGETALVRPTENPPLIIAQLYFKIPSSNLNSAILH